MREQRFGRRPFIAAVGLLSAPFLTRSIAWTADAPRVLDLPVRWQEASGDGCVEKTGRRQLVPAESAIVICDLWNQHWCASATRRCGEIAVKIAPLIAQARAVGIHIVHAPSDTLAFYAKHPARQRALALKPATPPSPIGGWCSLEEAREGKLPIDDSDGGCDCQPQCKNYKAWSRQHPAVTIADGDLISDNGREVYSFFVAEGIKNVLYMGVHTNMCVLGRSFGIRQMTKLGFKTLLVRDLTDTMYNPRKAPFVEHAAGTDLVIKHVERHWCPSLDSVALWAGLRG